MSSCYYADLPALSDKIPHTVSFVINRIGRIIDTVFLAIKKPHFLWVAREAVFVLLTQSRIQQNPADEDVLSFHLKVRRRIPFFGIWVVSLKLPDNKNHLFYLIWRHLQAYCLFPEHNKYFPAK